MTQLSFLPEAPPAPNGESDEFYTPNERWDPWHREANFTLDACATAESAKVPRFHTKEQDGLVQSWSGERVWCNPPYSDIAPWVQKAHEEVRSLVKPCQCAWLLLPANKSEQPWWQKYIEPYRDLAPDRERSEALLLGIALERQRIWTVTTRFLVKRIAFGYPGNPQGGKGSGWFPSVLVIWRRVARQ